MDSKPGVVLVLAGGGRYARIMLGEKRHLQGDGVEMVDGGDRER